MYQISLLRPSIECLNLIVIGVKYLCLFSEMEYFKLHLQLFINTQNMQKDFSNFKM